VDESGRVVGIAARQFGEELRLRARRGVVLASGGFVFNDTMVARHVPQIQGYTKIGTEGDDGRGIQMAQAMGAATSHMSGAQVAIWASPALMCRSLLVNGEGQRFVNEDTYAGRIGQRALLAERGLCYLVLNEAAFADTPEYLRMGQRPTWVAETVAELEQEIGLPERSLQTTVEVYNYHARRGSDPAFHKRSSYVRPLTPPFAAIDLRARPYADRSGYLVFTLGGLSTSPQGHVLDMDGESVPGLYAAGRASAGIAAYGYISGTSIGDATFFGRRAGRSAAHAIA
jgi:3-oxo-5alpha-steroid 4-dehydrogenase